MWFSTKYFGFIFKSMFGSEIDKTIYDTMLPVNPRKKGIEIDGKITKLGYQVLQRDKAPGTLMYSRRGDKSDIKRLLGVYYEQNVTTEKYEDYDGERWIVLGDI